MNTFTLELLYEPKIESEYNGNFAVKKEYKVITPTEKKNETKL